MKIPCSISADTIWNCFFRGLITAVPDEPFLEFPSDEVPASFTQETFAQYVNFDDNLEITGLQNDADISEAVLQNKQVENNDSNEVTLPTQLLQFCQKIKKCYMHLI